jgi:hypothetical protein
MKAPDAATWQLTRPVGGVITPVLEERDFPGQSPGIWRCGFQKDRKVGRPWTTAKAGADEENTDYLQV